MKKPEDWYGFRTNCDLHDFGMSNMSSSEKQQYCKRFDRKGNFRPSYDQLKCHWNVCPKLKKERKPLLKKKVVLKVKISKKAAKKLKRLDEMENPKTEILKCKVCGRKPEIYESSFPIWNIYCEQITHEIRARARTEKTAIKRWNKINETM